MSLSVLTLLGCAPTSEPSGREATRTPSVFPPPDQLVLDHLVTSLDASEPSADRNATTATPDAAGAEEAPHLTLQVESGTLMYPRTMQADESISLGSSFALTAGELSAKIELSLAASKEDLVAGRTRAVPFSLAEQSGDGVQAGTSWLLKADAPFARGHWYRLRFASSLKGAAPLPLGVEAVSYLRGPEPLVVTDVACGWPACTNEDHWVVSFNAELDPSSLPGCFSTRPALDLGTPRAEGWSVVLSPRGAKVASEYRLVVNARCRSKSADHLDAPYVKQIRIEAPRARLALARGTGYQAPLAGSPPIVKIGAAHTGRLTLGTRRITREALPAFLAANLENWGGLAFTAASAERTWTLVPPGADLGDVVVPVPLGDALEGDRGIVYLRVQAERPGDDDSPPLREALVQVTELGLSVKSGPEDTLVWVSSLIDQQPVAGVELQALDSKGKTLWTRTTDLRGLAVGPGRKDTAEEGETRIIMAAKGADLAYLDLSEYANRSEPYEFGLPHAWDARSNALRGIVFTDRGVYRAGEVVHVKGLVRVDRGRQLERVAAQTIAVSITNPLGDRVLLREVELGLVGDFELELPLGDAASLGSWHIEAEAPQAANGKVETGFRVEAYRRNTFEVKVGELARVGDHLQASVAGRYYYGAPMAGARARWWVHRADADFAPAAYPDFAFEVPAWSDDHWEPVDASVAVVASGTGELDKTGKLAIDADFSAILGSLADGPEELHVVLLDNGRSDILADPSFRDALRCIRCGACLNACPVYRKIGGHAYGGVYPGPIGAVITPLLRGVDAYPDLPHATSLCGACHAACPVDIDLPRMLVALRKGQLARRQIGWRVFLCGQNCIEHSQDEDTGANIKGQFNCVRDGPVGGLIRYLKVMCKNVRK